MQSQIDDELSPKERAVLAMYRSNTPGLRKAVRLSVQYAVGAGIFAYLAIADRQPLYVLVVYAVFLLFMLARLRGASKLAGIMPGIIEKYERRIAALSDSTPPKNPSDSN